FAKSFRHVFRQNRRTVAFLSGKGPAKKYPLRNGGSKRGASGPDPLRTQRRIRSIWRDRFFWFRRSPQHDEDGLLRKGIAPRKTRTGLPLGLQHDEPVQILGTLDQFQSSPPPPSRIPRNCPERAQFGILRTPALRLENRSHARSDHSLFESGSQGEVRVRRAPSNPVHDRIGLHRRSFAKSRMVLRTNSARRRSHDLDFRSSSSDDPRAVPAPR